MRRLAGAKGKTFIIIRKAGMISLLFACTLFLLPAGADIV